MGGIDVKRGVSGVDVKRGVFGVDVKRGWVVLMLREGVWC